MQREHGRVPAALVASVLAGRGTAQGVIYLQRTVGNRAVGRLLAAAGGGMQREEESESGPRAEPPGGALTEQEGEEFEALLGGMSDEEIDAAFEALESDGLEAEAEPVGAPEVEGTQADVGVPTIQRGKSLLAQDNADIGLANRLERNRSKRPRLVTLGRWRTIKKKHAKRGHRKYAAIRHQNLTDDLGKQDLVLLVKLKRRPLPGSLLDQHYEGIEKKSNRKRQTSRIRTELLGEVVTSLRMESYLGGNCELLVGYSSGGPGIDQLWVDHTQKAYYVVEAKGPGATVKTNRFAVRGVKNGGSLTQMSQEWVEDRLLRLGRSQGSLLKQLLTDCGLQTDDGETKIERNRSVKKPAYDLKGLVITADWDTTTGELSSSLSNRKYRF